MMLKSKRFATVGKTQISKPKLPSRADVFILESLKFGEEERYKEGEIIKRTLTMWGKKPEYHYFRTEDEFEFFLKKFSRSPHRYLHVSMHGGSEGFDFTLGNIDIVDFTTRLAPAIHGKRLFISACSATTKQLAEELFQKSECNSIMGPIHDIAFTDSVAFWTLFYHLMFTKNKTSMSNFAILSNALKAGLILEEDFAVFFPEKGTRRPLKEMIRCRKK